MSDSPSTLPLIEALWRRPHAGVPCWFMRQAGRYLPGYQKVRAQHDFLSLCKAPDLAAEVTVEPLDTFGVDAVIIFSDILVPLEAMGMDVQFGDRGPYMEKPLDSRADIDALRDFDPDEGTGYVMEVIRQVRQRVAGRVPVLGFAGAPWTLACYALEGSPSRTFSKAFGLLYREPETMHRLLERLADTIAGYLRAQVEAGAQAIQLFDTWGGMLPHDQFEAVSLAYCRRILDQLSDVKVPRILFIKGAGLHLEKLLESGADAVAVDAMQDLGRVRTVNAGRVALQGNLAPEALLGSRESLLARAKTLLDTMAGEPGYVFNLGHGILPTTPVDNVRALVDFIHEYSANRS